MPSRYDKSDLKYDLSPVKLPKEEIANPLIRILSDFNGSAVVTKPWGREIILSKNEGYTFKRIEIFKGFETSLQYHEKKGETIIFISGVARVVFEEPAKGLVCVDMHPGSIFEVVPPAIHRVIAVTDISYFEASTPDPNGLDVIRIRDGFKRKDGRIENEY